MTYKCNPNTWKCMWFSEICRYSCTYMSARYQLCLATVHSASSRAIPVSGTGSSRARHKKMERRGSPPPRPPLPPSVSPCTVTHTRTHARARLRGGGGGGNHLVGLGGDGRAAAATEALLFGFESATASGSAHKASRC